MRANSLFPRQILATPDEPVTVHRLRCDDDGSGSEHALSLVRPPAAGSTERAGAVPPTPGARLPLSTALPPVIMRIVAEYVPTALVLHSPELRRICSEGNPEVAEALDRALEARDMYLAGKQAEELHRAAPPVRTGWSRRAEQLRSLPVTVASLGLSRLLLPVAEMAAKVERTTAEIDRLQNLLQIAERSAWLSVRAEPFDAGAELSLRAELSRAVCDLDTARAVTSARLE